MAEPLTAFGAALAIVFVAEFADKTQFAILAMTGRGQPVQVFIGAAAAFVAMAVLAAVLGDLAGDRIPLRWVAVAAGAVFIGLGVWGLRPEREQEAESAEGGIETVPATRRPGWVGVFVLIFLAEFGDRTQIAIVALAARNGHPAWTAAGAALALVATAGITVLAGRWLRSRLPVERIERASAILFILVGVVFVMTPWLPVGL